MNIDLFESVTECGCAAKVPAQELAGMLRGVEVPRSPAVLVGPDTLDDAGVYQLSDEQCLVQTVDFFPPVARDLDGVPLLDGALGFAEQGLLSAAAYTNRDYVGDAVRFDDDLPLSVRTLLFDPQTSGGLLICCPQSRLSELLGWAREELSTPFGVVGRVVEAAPAPSMRVRRRAVAAGEDGPIS